MRHLDMLILRRRQRAGDAAAQLFVPGAIPWARCLEPVHSLLKLRFRITTKCLFLVARSTLEFASISIRACERVEIVRKALDRNSLISFGYSLCLQGNTPRKLFSGYQPS